MPVTGGKMQFWGIPNYDEQTDKRGVSAHNYHHDPVIGTPNQRQGPIYDPKNKIPDNKLEKYRGQIKVLH